jgi:predicted ArsR family transcriptional regulator
VRLQLSALERDGLLQRRGVVHSGRAGQPAAEYELTREGEDALSRAYRPVMTALVKALGSRLDHGNLRRVFGDTGRRLASSSVDPSSPLAARAASCAALIESLGGSATVRVNRREATIEGAGCPLAAAVREEPATCYIIEALIAQHGAVKARQRCQHGDNPRCRFELSIP